MTEEELIKLARKAGFMQHLGVIAIPNIQNLERFADLAIKPWADQLKVERKRFQELNEVAALGMQHARADEREACAQLCEEHWRNGGNAMECADAIRARGKDPMPLFDDWPGGFK